VFTSRKKIFTFLYGIINAVNQNRKDKLQHPIIFFCTKKPQLMITRNLINKALVLSVYIIAGFLLARSMYYGSFTGMVLAIVAMVAWTLFLYKLSKVQTEKDPTEELFRN
jgi:hypothetical protein